MHHIGKKIFPPNEGWHPYIYLVNMFIPFYFMLQEPSYKQYLGLLLLIIFVMIYRQVFWSARFAKLLIATEVILTLGFGFLYNPMYLYLIFVFAFQIVRLPLKWMYLLCGSFTVTSLYLIYQTVFFNGLYLLISLIPPLFGGSILPFIMKTSLRYKELNENLQRVAEELEKKNQEKTLLEESKKRMLADISHDLKTPMTTIQGYSKALYEGMIEDEDQKKKFLKYIHDKSIRVNALIDELFMFSKLDSPDFPINKEEKDLCEFFREIIVEYYELFEAKEMELDIDIPSNPNLYRFDQKLLYRAISNILENIIKYNTEKTMVYIRLSKCNDSMTMEIGDNGVGIDEELAHSLFDPFVRGDKSRMNDGGSGLGLAITRKIIEKHNGKVDVDVNPKRGKTNFIIELPI
ncbi:sensor histidine kinase [Bacillus sp. CGMCC 1.16607]|uniref:sensor histidine kinase n=1 Tax=Bacillus sp. CGMCC 1.16607 TaxID=3351842 RepID=UPI00363A23E4